MTSQPRSTIRPLPSRFAGRLYMPLEYVEQIEAQLTEIQRDKAEHRAYMREINKLWENIPEKFAKAPWAKSADAFRKYALCSTGHCDVDVIAFESQAHAARAAPTIAYIARMGHGYAITNVEGSTVVCVTPFSQAYSKMSREQFKASKQDVLDHCRGIVGVGV